MSKRWLKLPIKGWEYMLMHDATYGRAVNEDVIKLSGTHMTKVRARKREKTREIGARGKMRGLEVSGGESGYNEITSMRREVCIRPEARRWSKQ